MKKILIIVGVVIIAGAVYFFTRDSAPIAVCPDELIVNEMPGPGMEAEAYYIQDGKRVEVTAYDSAWVEENCEVPVQTVQ